MSAMRRVRERSAAPVKHRAAWLSLFAMLMIFIGPLISQSMPMDQHAGMSMPPAMSMDMGSSADSHAHHGSEHATAADAGAGDHALWAKCGYCTLLFSCPALPYVPVVVAAAVLRHADFFTAQTRLGHAQRAIFPNARSRAPPTRFTDWNQKIS
ncbi:DUF2946 domain-containing protein [Pseudomonas alliivorans]|uniref:DUF2946 domain-containing protein n=1 Tax=Pseudomonas alliivorans TaxID=2810613 RepID=UPI001AE30BE4|nr:DUF2946 domain-containing protein [Pseudomonas alliivorans]MBP0951300.1 DUF2946 domain-containing protein [Pseudomonas alliivorans]MCO5367300.1 DUF2946 domain-containing protein [Pseudomonas alliivorans]MEE4305614.1 DUF2946 domain-containing protein [Pseudomonas alliivorans]MEE4685541.1 DUF2946 domain-containing protein [Pseudomonas alliivorans]MEE4745538.1 DUF2946 domain-containing protein [Pseudomonas alliivorans]